MALRGKISDSQAFCTCADLEAPDHDGMKHNAYRRDCKVALPSRSADKFSVCGVLIQPIRLCMAMMEEDSNGIIHGTRSDNECRASSKVERKHQGRIRISIFLYKDDVSSLLSGSTTMDI
mmetsp:Transcript_4241/g.9605  ORF Transcript_4241/g.9605 Transcript_4241/m.9605 type:complete len:120 (-) Transcript_4241:248-607(-)